MRSDIEHELVFDFEYLYYLKRIFSDSNAFFLLALTLEILVLKLKERFKHKNGTATEAL